MAAEIPHDERNLQLLTIFHYVVSAMVFLFSSVFIIHIAMGIMFLVAPGMVQNGSSSPPPAFMGWIFIVMGAGVVLSGWATAVCLILAGRFLARRKRYTFCFVVAVISCLFMPFGTALGIFTIIVLSQPSVKTLFGKTV